MNVIIIFFTLLFSMTSYSASREEMEQKIVADLAGSLAQIKTPEEALSRVRSRLKPQEVEYLQSLISKKLWVEMPTVQSNKNTVLLKFSNNKTLPVEIVDYWTGEYVLSGYKLEMDKYPKLEERMAYLRRVMQSKVLNQDRQGASLFSLFFPAAHASLTCNSIVSSGCLEVSMATSLWLIRTVSEESPLMRCKENYYYNKNQDMTKKCLAQFNNSPTITTIQELSEVLAQAPDTSIDITCNKGEGPDIWINGSEVIRLGKGFERSDYSISMEQDRKSRLSKLPELAIRCCQKKSSDPLAGHCEEFVTNHLGSKENRRNEFKSPNLRLRGKEVDGVR